MFSKPVIIGTVGGLMLVFALALNYFVIDGDEGEPSATKIEVRQAPPKPASPTPGTSPPAKSTAMSTAKPTAAPSATGETKAAAEESQPATQPAAKPEPVKPSFDVVRVDPEGNAVIAGRAAPNTKVTISDGEQKIGEVQADSRGEWVFVPDSRLPSGNRVLSLRSESEDGDQTESDQAVVVVIPEVGKDIAGKETDKPSVPLAMVIPKTKEVVAPSVVLQAPKASAQPAAQPPAQSESSDVARATANAPSAVPAAKQAVKQVAEAAKDTVVAAATVGTRAPSASSAAAASGASVKADPAPTEPEKEISHPAPTEFQLLKSVTGGAKPAPASSTPVAKSFPEPKNDNQLVLSKPERKPEISLDVVDYDDKGSVVFSGTTEPGKDVQVYVDNKLAGRTKADDKGKWAVTPGQKIEPGTHTVRIDRIAPKGNVLARIELPFVRAMPLRDLPAGQVVVIQPGNNLWRIATRVYGSGIRYHEIHSANLDQIRDPNLIYPGQVFGLPKLN